MPTAAALPCPQPWFSVLDLLARCHRGQLGPQPLCVYGRLVIEPDSGQLYLDHLPLWELPRVELPRLELPRSELPKSESPESELPAAERPHADDRLLLRLAHTALPALKEANAGGSPHGVQLSGLLSPPPAPGLSWVLQADSLAALPSAWPLQAPLAPLPLAEQHAILDAPTPWAAVQAVLNQASAGAYQALLAQPDSPWAAAQRTWLEAERWRLFDNLDLPGFHAWAQRQAPERHGIHGQPAEGWCVVREGDSWVVSRRDAAGALRYSLCCFAPDTALAVALGGLLQPLLGRDPTAVRFEGDTDGSDLPAYRQRALAAAEAAWQQQDWLRAELLLTQALDFIARAKPSPLETLLPLFHQLGTTLLARGRAFEAQRVIQRYIDYCQRIASVPAWMASRGRVLLAWALLEQDQREAAVQMARQVLRELQSVSLDEPQQAMVARLRSECERLLSLGASLAGAGAAPAQQRQSAPKVVPTAPDPAETQAGIAALLQRQVALLPLGWRELVLLWRGGEEGGEFRAFCLMGGPEGLRALRLPVAENLNSVWLPLRAQLHAQAKALHPGALAAGEARLHLNRVGRVQLQQSAGPAPAGSPWPAPFPEHPGR